MFPVHMLHFISTHIESLTLQNMRRWFLFHCDSKSRVSILCDSGRHPTLCISPKCWNHAWGFPLPCTCEDENPCCKAVGLGSVLMVVYRIYGLWRSELLGAYDRDGWGEHHDGGNGNICKVHIGGFMSILETAMHWRLILCFFWRL